MGTRTFLALPCAEAVSQRVCQLIDQLDQFASDVKWVAPENLHLTLKFFGNIDDSDLVDILRTVQPIVESWSPINVEFAGAGAFPSLSRPRTLWVGLTGGGDEVVSLQHAIDKALSRRGYPGERRRFHPHLTVGRVRDGARQQQLAQRLKDFQNFTVGESTLDEVELLSSQLLPTGPVYTVMARFEMGVG